MSLDNLMLSAESRRKTIALIAAIIVQIAVLGVTYWIVVIIPDKEEEPHFVAQKTIYLPQENLEHQAAVNEFSQAADAPMALDVLSVTALLPDNTLALPQLPVTAFSLSNSENSAMDAQVLLSDATLLSQLTSKLARVSTACRHPVCLLHRGYSIRL